jgi:hypothetical protein
MAWRGESEDVGIWYTTGTTSSSDETKIDWKIGKEKQKKIWGIGSNDRPALTSTPFILVCEVPDCRGQKIEEAQTVLTNAGLKLGKTWEKPPEPPLPEPPDPTGPR